MTHIGHSGKVLVMRIFIAVLFLILNLQSWTKADDISDFQIEGMSIGDSLLDYFSKNEINKFLKADTTHFYTNSDYAVIGIYKENQNSISLNNYDSLGITINKKDNKYKILSIGGQNYSYDDINDCSTTQASIANDIKKDVLENNINENIWENDKYKSGGIIIGKSKMHDFYYNDNSSVRIICYELNDEERKKARWKVKMEVIINSKEFTLWLRDS